MVGRSRELNRRRRLERERKGIEGGEEKMADRRRGRGDRMRDVLFEIGIVCLFMCVCGRKPVCVSVCV